MHSFSKHQHKSSGDNQPKMTRGLVLNTGGRYDLMEWFFDTLFLHGKLRELRRRTADLARIQTGETVLDVGCGTGTLAMLVAPRVGSTGRVFGIDPGVQQIARARSKAARQNLPVEFQAGVIEHLDFPDQTFDAVLSTIMMHHLSDTLKRQGLAEIFRVLRPGGRLVIADFEPPDERPNRRGRFGPGGSRMENLETFVQEAGFSQVATEEMPLPRFPGHSAGSAGFVSGTK